MKKTLNLSLFLLISVTVFINTGCNLSRTKAEAKLLFTTGDVKVVNKSSQPIEELYFRRITRTDWGSDYLSSPIDPEENKTLYFIDTGIYTIRAVGSTGDVFIKTNYWVVAASCYSLKIYDEDIDNSKSVYVEVDSYHEGEDASDYVFDF